MIQTVNITKNMKLQKAAIKLFMKKKKKKSLCTSNLGARIIKYKILKS